MRKTKRLSPAQLHEAMDAAGLHQRQALAAALDCSDNRVTRMLNGDVVIPGYIGLAMETLVRRYENKPKKLPARLGTKKRP